MTGRLPVEIATRRVRVRDWVVGWRTCATHGVAVAELADATRPGLPVCLATLTGRAADCGCGRPRPADCPYGAACSPVAVPAGEWQAA